MKVQERRLHCQKWNCLQQIMVSACSRVTSAMSSVYHYYFIINFFRIFYINVIIICIFCYCKCINTILLNVYYESARKEIALSKMELFAADNVISIDDYINKKYQVILPGDYSNIYGSGTILCIININYNFIIITFYFLKFCNFIRCSNGKYLFIIFILGYINMCYTNIFFRYISCTT